MPNPDNIDAGLSGLSGLTVTWSVLHPPAASDSHFDIVEAGIKSALAKTKDTGGGTAGTHTPYDSTPCTTAPLKPEHHFICVRRGTPATDVSTSGKDGQQLETT